jgi:hypothetical protein
VLVVACFVGVMLGWRDLSRFSRSADFEGTGFGLEAILTWVRPSAVVLSCEVPAELGVHLDMQLQFTQPGCSVVRSHSG